ncbi:MAG: AMP-dependent synthetase/ligase [Vicingaceae bacterium]|nr:AMP-dependent synthetase/ligase [Vicingaceae bacterium]
MINQVKTISDFYYYQLQHTPRTDAFTQKENGKWQPLSIEVFVEKSKHFSLGLLQLGINKGDRIAIISNNRTEWHLTDLAAQQIGIVNVPIYPNITEEDYTYILNDCGAKAVFVSSQELLTTIEYIKSNVPELKHVYTYDEIAGKSNYKEVLELGKDGDESSIKALKDAIKQEELATLIYTSGTTGKPKGVMLSHQNLVANVLASEERLPIGKDFKVLSFLPLCHVFERMIDYLFIYKGISIYYAESLETIADNLKEVKPHLFATVPRLLEKVYDKIVAKGSDLSGIKKALFFWALDLGLEFDPMEDKGWWYNFRLKIANKIIFSKWREALGGNVVAIVSGGAALQARLARVFTAAQIPILEGYGLTETSPVIAVNSLLKEGTKIGTVGKPLDNLDVKIAEDGEIIVKGPSIMMGYYNLPDVSKEVFDSEGYFHTGDIGVLEDGKYLKITDRKKEIFKTSGGKYIAPQVMENKFKESRFIEQIIVIGEGEKFAGALIQPDFAFLKDWCDRKNIKATTNEEMITNEQVIKRFEREVKELNENFSNYEKIKQFELLSEPLSIDAGELTPTLKLKRKNILAKYNHLYQKIYA